MRFFRNCNANKLGLLLILIIITASIIIIHVTKITRIQLNQIMMDFRNADSVNGFDYAIVPNIFHYVHFENPDLSFIEVVSIRSVHANHRPDKIIIHCDCTYLLGKYWDMVKDISYIEIRFKAKPTHIFNQTLGNIYHASDIARLEIMMAEGGIYLDSDVYVVKSLDPYRKFEIAIGWHPGENIGTQVIVAHKDARFLKMWYDSYRYYNPQKWYFNAGELPTQMILDRDPSLVHRVLYDFGVHMLVRMLYANRTDEWKKFSCIHLLIRHRSYLVKDDPVPEFDENNIKRYNRTFGDMARLVLYNTTELL